MDNLDTLPMSSEESAVLGSVMGSTDKAQKREKRSSQFIMSGEDCLILDPSLLNYHNACLVKACLRKHTVVMFPPEDGHWFLPWHQIEAHVICQYFQENMRTHTHRKTCYFAYLLQRN